MDDRESEAIELRDTIMKEVNKIVSSSGYDRDMIAAALIMCAYEIKGYVEASDVLNRNARGFTICD